MATITATDMTAVGSVTVTETTLSASDTFTLDLSKRPILIIDNGTGGSVSPVLVGDAAPAAYSVQGVGDIDLSSGYTYTVANGAVAAVHLASVKEYLRTSTVTVTGADGAVAKLLEF